MLLITTDLLDRHPTPQALDDLLLQHADAQGLVLVTPAAFQRLWTHVAPAPTSGTPARPGASERAGPGVTSGAGPGSRPGARGQLFWDVEGVRLVVQPYTVPLSTGVGETAQEALNRAAGL